MYIIQIKFIRSLIFFLFIMSINVAVVKCFIAQFLCMKLYFQTTFTNVILFYWRLFYFCFFTSNNMHSDKFLPAPSFSSSVFFFSIFSHSFLRLKSHLYSYNWGTWVICFARLRCMTSIRSFIATLNLYLTATPSGFQSNVGLVPCLSVCRGLRI